MNAPAPIVVGIFVGGRSRRMGGTPKGLLVAPDGRTIVERTIALARSVADEVVLVGTNDAYASLGLRALVDARANSGPLAALVALLEFAANHRAIAIACDMPRLTSSMVAKLANEVSRAAIVAPRDGDKWSPLFARYDAAHVLEAARAQLAEGVLSLQPLLERVTTHALVLDEDERRALADWDRPEDIDRS